MKTLKFEPLSIRRTSERIEKRIKDSIFDGTLKSGDRLPTEKEMAEQFRVSVVTLREALRALEIFGLIEKRKGQKGGIFISGISSKSIKNSLEYFLSFKHLSAHHLYEVRKIIEPSVIKLVLYQITPNEINKLEENVSYCEELLKNLGSLLDKKTFFDLDRINNDFHTIIAESTHNPILILTVDYVLDFLPEFETKILVPDINYCKDNVRDHRNILESIKERDKEECEKKMLAHLERLDEYLKNRKADFTPRRRGSIKKSHVELIQNR